MGNYEQRVTALATEDVRCHRATGVDLNPFSTNRARASWKNGFDGRPMSLLDWADEHHRGKACAELLSQPTRVTGE